MNKPRKPIFPTYAAGVLLALVAAPLTVLASEFSYEPADANRDAYVTVVEQRNYDLGLWQPGDPVPQPYVAAYVDDMRLADGRIDPGLIGGE